MTDLNIINIIILCLNMLTFIILIGILLSNHNILSTRINDLSTRVDNNHDNLSTRVDNNHDSLSTYISDLHDGLSFSMELIIKKIFK